MDWKFLFYMFYTQILSLIPILLFYNVNGYINNSLDDGLEARTIDELHFPSVYHATGRIILPSSRITEPFETWYSSSNKRSRIDFYNGNVKTYQRLDLGKYGTEYHIIPKYDYRHDNHYVGCWKKTGKKKAKLSIQSVLPKKVYWPFKMNVTEYKFSGYTKIRGQSVIKWIADIERFNRSHHYQFYSTIDKPFKPIRLEMIGYDVVLTSYYDNYTIEYDTFDEWQYDAEVFEIPRVAKRDKWCWEVKPNHGTGGPMTMNPFAELIDSDYEYDALWQKRYKKHQIAMRKQGHRRVKHHPARIHRFKHHVRYIESMNRLNTNYSLAANLFTGLTDEESKARSGLELESSEGHHRRYIHSNQDQSDRFSYNVNMTVLPDHVDWRVKGAVNEVQSQAICGSCWAFSTVAAFEASHYIKTGKLIKLSEQELVDCTWYVPSSKEGNNGCLGGWSYKTMAFVKERGISKSKDYGNYRGMESQCNSENTTSKFKIDSYMAVKPYNTESMRRALAFYGPVVTSMCTHHTSVKFYKSGIYNNKHCGTDSDHSVLVVGYGFDHGHLYWIVRNSWSKHWGENGYMRIKNGNCGLLQKPWVVITRNHDKFDWSNADQEVQSDNLISGEE